MQLHLVTAEDNAPEKDMPEHALPPPETGWRGHAANACYLLVKASGFLATSYLMTLGLPLLFFLLLSGGDAALFFAQLGNFADRFLGAGPDRQAGFVNELTIGLVALATLVAGLRLPGFLREVAEDLREVRQ